MKCRKILKKNEFLYQIVKKMHVEYNKIVGAYKLKRAVKSKKPLKIVIGASGQFDRGWIPTEIYFLNLLKESDWERFFKPNTIDAILMESVLEYFDEKEVKIALERCFKYLKSGGYLRICVPDGYHIDKEFVKSFSSGKSNIEGVGCTRVIYNYKTIKKLFKSVGFNITLYEYFDEDGNYHDNEYDDSKGTIHRSKRFGRKTIILDAVK